MRVTACTQYVALGRPASVGPRHREILKQLIALLEALFKTLFSLQTKRVKETNEASEIKIE